MVAVVISVTKKTARVRLEVREGVKAGSDIRLDKSNECLQVPPVCAVMASKQDGGLKAERVGRTNLVADILEVDPRRDRGQPAPLDLSNIFGEPRGEPADS